MVKVQITNGQAMIDGSKTMEEAQELCKAKTHDEVVWEAADLFYFSTVLMTRAGVTVQEVINELDRRNKK